jgi:hypothetical protein
LTIIVSNPKAGDPAAKKEEAKPSKPFDFLFSCLCFW